MIIIGNLTKDIDMKYLSTNTPIATGSIATSYKYKTKSGEQKEEVCFLDFTIFGKIAEVANKYLHKGSKIMLDGRLKFEQWTDNQTQLKKSKHILLVNEMKMLDSRSDNQNRSYNEENSWQNKNIKTQDTNSSNINTIPVINVDDIPSDDEIPF